VSDLQSFFSSQATGASAAYTHKSSAVFVKVLQITLVGHPQNDCDKASCCLTLVGDFIVIFRLFAKPTVNVNTKRLFSSGAQ